jgi:PilZ domain-containing protein
MSEVRVTTLSQPERFVADRGRDPDRHVRQPGTVAPLGGTSTKVENRSAVRYSASEVPSITGIRLSPHGANATLMNISASGVLVESTNRFRLATPVTVVFDGTFSPSSVEGRVARSFVANVSKNGVLRYHVGIAFNDPIALEKAPAPANRLPEPVPDLEVAPPSPPVQAVLVNRW